MLGHIVYKKIKMENKTNKLAKKKVKEERRRIYKKELALAGDAPIIRHKHHKWTFFCPICGKRFDASDYLCSIFKDDDNEGTPTSLVDFAVPKIMVNDLPKILDPRVGLPEINEAEAVELVAFTAMLCVNLEGKDRPTMADIVANLDRALSLCDGSHGCISSGTISIVSD